MRPQQQTRKEKDGDCLRAVVASLIDLSIQSVPDFVLAPTSEGDQYPGYWQSLQGFLSGFDLFFLEIALPPNFPWQPLPFAGLCILFGETENGIRHAVVGRVEHDQFSQVFNPWPEAQIQGIAAVGFLVPREPGRYMKMGNAMAKVERLSAPSKLTGQYGVSDTVAESIHQTAREALNRDEPVKLHLNGHQR